MCALLVPAIARAGGVVPEEGTQSHFGTPGQDIVITTPGERTTKNIAVIASVAGLGTLLGGLGLYFHLQSRDDSNQVEATNPTSKPWTPADQSAFDSAHSARTDAAIFYSLGGAMIIGALVALIVTDPKEETSVIHPHSTVPTIVPMPGGAMLGGMWRF